MKKTDDEIVFRPGDDMMTHAENIWYALGFANDRMNHIAQIAGYLSMYRDWDNEHATTGKEGK